MSEEQLARLREAAQKIEQETARSPARAREMLVREGIYTQDGKLAAPYK